MVDAGQVDALPLADDPRGDVDGDGHHVCGGEVDDGVHGLRERGPVQVVRVERPLVEHESQEDGGDGAYD